MKLAFTLSEVNIKSENVCLSPSTPVPLQNTKVEETVDCSSSVSKVVVQAMPFIDFGNITALQHCISDDSISRKSCGGSDCIKKDSTKNLTKNVESPSTTKISKLQANFSSGTRTQADDIPSSYSVKMIRKNRILNFRIYPGKGMKLGNIEYIVSSLSDAAPRTLRLLHYIMFGTYGVITNDFLLERTKRNILHFSGFIFDEFGEDYSKKHNSLIRLPYPLLLDMYILLVREVSRERITMAKQLIEFLLKPTKRKESLLKKYSEVYNDVEIKEMKMHILKEPSPVVMLERLTEKFIKKMLNQADPGLGLGASYCSSGTYSSDHCNKYSKPEYIVDGPGQKLKSFPDVVEGVSKARRRIINLLHSFLYGRPGSDAINRLNILEFSGFLQYKKSLLQRRVAILSKYRNKELEQICNIFSLRVKGGNKNKKIKKLLLYLQAPSLDVNCKRTGRELQNQAEGQVTEKLMTSSKETVTKCIESPVSKLRDFEKIRVNVECAPPEELTELNDLMFIKPCDISEIHEKILNFTPFSFDENSFEFHYRRTLMHYMSFGIIRKMAHLLDIPFWEQYRCQQDLAMTTLKFLMEMKQPAKVSKRAKFAQYHETNQRVRRSAHSPKQRPVILKVQRDQNLSSDREDSSGYFGSSLSGRINSTHVSNGFHEKGDWDDISNPTVVIQRISESSYSWTDLKNNGPLTISNLNSDESLSLHDFSHHPTESQLELTIKDVICSNSWSITTGDLLNKVLHYYPKYNLTYRCDFIKAKALEILQEMQECLVDSTLEMP